MFMSWFIFPPNSFPSCYVWCWWCSFLLCMFGSFNSFLWNNFWNMLNLFKMSCRYVRISPETKYILVLYNPSAAVCSMTRCLSNQKVLWNGMCASPWGLFIGFKRVNSKQFMECCASVGCFSKFYYVLHVGSYFDLDYKWFTKTLLFI